MTREEQGAENRLLGRWGEYIVAEDMQKLGWEIIAVGYRTRFGEIDLIASNHRYLSFTEVKLRKDADHGTAAESVDRRKQARIRATAEMYLARFPTALQPRFDVAEVYAPQGYHTKKPEINYILNAF